MRLCAYRIVGAGVGLRVGNVGTGVGTGIRVGVSVVGDSEGAGVGYGVVGSYVGHGVIGFPVGFGVGGGMYFSHSNVGRCVGSIVGENVAMVGEYVGSGVGEPVPSWKVQQVRILRRKVEKEAKRNASQAIGAPVAAGRPGFLAAYEYAAPPAPAAEETAPLVAA